MAKLVKSEMKRHKEWSLDSAAVGVAWLDDQVSKRSNSSLASLLIYILFYIKHAILFSADVSGCYPEGTSLLVLQRWK